MSHAVIGTDYQKIERRMPETKQRVRLNIFTTPSEQSLPYLRQASLKSVKGVFLAYDVTDKETFDEMPRYFKEIKDSAPVGVSIVLIGDDLTKENRTRR